MFSENEPENLTPKKVNLQTVTLIVVVVILGLGNLAFLGDEILFDDDDEKSSPMETIYDPVIDPDNFVTGIDNSYLPFSVGSKWVYEAETEDGTERIEVVVTNDTRVIMGITCIVVRDTVTIGGELVEDTYDWYAQDQQGNVWYMGEDSTEYEDGETSKAGSWEGGVDGAKPGIIMLANPLASLSYRQEYYKDEAEDMAEVIHLNQSVTIDLGTYNNVLVIREWNPLEPGVLEDKYYAPGVGVIMEKVVRGDPEQVELVEVSTG